ncbi:MAG: sigma-54-dependent transcriptional regulator [Bdellovibrionota bacterium]|jgi:two-component system response regulator AtoC
MAKILIVDDEESVRRIISIQLKRLGHEAFEAPDGPEALEVLKNQSISTVVTDLKMPKMDGLELLQRLRKSHPEIPVIMMTAHGTIDTAVEAMKRGAFDYVTKPFNQADFLETIERAIRSADELKKEFQRSRSFLKQEEKIIGTTEEMEKVYSIIERVANNQSNVLITGETGTGKEVVGRLLHDKSSRRDRPLVRAYISASQPDQQLSYLFGDEKKLGCLELAEDGSLYLDEVGAMSLEVQAKFFDAITSSEFESPKGRRPIQCRIIAASDYNLLEKIENGQFRKDLFYALNVVPIYLPPLRERTQDIEPLVDHFIKIFSRKFDKHVSHIDEEALFFLIQYPWPGNTRELENCVEFAVNLASTPVITKDNLPRHLFSSPLQSNKEKNWDLDALAHRVQSLEKSAIEQALLSSGGDLLKASQKLGVPPSLLEQKATSLKIGRYS